jgi:hypothetical protein
MDTRGHPERTRRPAQTEPLAKEDANAERTRTSSSAGRSKDAETARSSPPQRYDEVDLRLMDTFPASDAVARY